MALSTRKKKGIGFFISGVAFIAAGGVFYFLEGTPEIVPTLFSLAGLIGNFLGFKLVFPDIME